MESVLKQTEAVLRGGLEFKDSISSWRIISRLLKYVFVCGILYGAVMGSYSGVFGDRLWQVLYSSAKVPFLLLGTFFICLPSFFVLNTLFGVRSDFHKALGALVASQAGLTLVLCALAPLTAFWYLSHIDYSAAILANGLMFGLATVGAQLILRRHYRPLIRQNDRHRLLLRTWLGLYLFVGLQLGWILRPFVGEPGLPAQLFRTDAWGNAYLSLLGHIWDVLKRQP